MPYRIDMTLPPDSNGQIQISCFGPDKTFDTEDDITIFVRYDKTNETGKIVLSSDGSDFYPYDDRVDRDNAINIEQPSWGENN